MPNAPLSSSPPPPPNLNHEAPMQVNPDPGEKNSSLLLKQSGGAPSHKRCPLFGPKETQACCIFIEHPLAWPFLLAETLQRRTFRDPVLALSVGGVGVGGALQWICKREKNEDAEIRVLWSLLQRSASLYTETKGKSADGAGGRILKRPSDETEFSGYPCQQEVGWGGAKSTKLNSLQPNIPSFRSESSSLFHAGRAVEKKNQYMVYIDINVEH